MMHEPTYAGVMPGSVREVNLSGIQLTICHIHDA